MKKTAWMIFTLLCICALALCMFVSCKRDRQGGEDNVPTSDTSASPGSDQTTDTPPNPHPSDSVSVKVYIDGVETQVISTDASSGYTITPPEKPKDIMTNPNSEKYFYGWFTDPNFQTPLFDHTTFEKGGAIFGKWVTVYSNNFKYTVSFGKATITGFTDDTPTVLVIPAYINSFPVTAIGKDAFKDRTLIRTVILCDGIEEIGGFNGCNSIERVDIPRSVTRIGDYCFARCGFKSFDIPSQIASIGEGAFAECPFLTQVKIPDSVTTIGSYAFRGCNGFTSLTVPKSVTIIGNNAFEGCTELNAVYITDIAAWCQITFGSEYSNPLYYAHNLYLNGKAITQLTIPNGITTIGDFAFRGCTSLTSVIISEGVATIGNSAFRDCTGLMSVTIPEGVTIIGGGAFYGCIGLTSVTIPEGVTTIGSGTFYGCTGLTGVTIPSSVTAISDSVFYYCTSLTNVTIPESVTTIDWYAFSGCTALTSVIIPEGVTTIHYFAFSDCTNLTSVTIPSSVIAIGGSAFEGCNKLIEVCNKSSLPIVKGSEDNGNVGYYALNIYTSTNGNSKLIQKGDYLFYVDSETVYLVEYNGKDKAIILPPNLDGKTYSIYKYAFCNRSDLTSVIMSEGITYIGRSAFKGCSGLMSITIPSSVTAIGWGAFNGWQSSQVIYCKAPSKPSGWNSDCFSGCSAKIVWGA